MDTDQMFVPYKEYQSIYPKWHIPNEVATVAPYWKWFVSKYITELAELFSYKKAAIPENWQGISESTAKQDIIKRYLGGTLP